MSVTTFMKLHTLLANTQPQPPTTPPLKKITRKYCNVFSLLLCDLVSFLFILKQLTCPQFGA